MSFPSVTAKDWRAQVEKELAGTPFDKALVHRTAEGLPVQPLYTKGPAGSLVDVDPQGTPFLICPRVDPAARAGTVSEELEGGADALWLDAASADGALATPGIGLAFLLLECAGVSPRTQLDRLSARLSPDAAFALGSDPFADVARGLLAPSGLAEARDALVQAARLAEERWPRAPIATVSTSAVLHDAVARHAAGTRARDRAFATRGRPRYRPGVADRRRSLPCRSRTPRHAPGGGGPGHVRRDVQAEGASHRLAQGTGRRRRHRGAPPAGARRLLLANARAARSVGEHPSSDDAGLRGRPRRRRSGHPHRLRRSAGSSLRSLRTARRFATTGLGAPRAW